MKTKQKTIYLITALIALLLPLSAWAFDLTSITSNNLFQPGATDKSITFLSELFGSVGGVLHSNSGQLLGELLGILNYGIVMLASSLMTYTIFLSVINTAQEGEFMGRGMKSAWVIVRSVSGLGLLVPQASGYCLAQVIIMWAVIQGVGLADKAWETAIDYLIHSGGVYAKEADSSDANNKIMNTINMTLPVSQRLLQSQVCTYKMENIFQQERKNLQTKYQQASTPELKQELKQMLAISQPQFGSFINSSAKTISFGFKTNSPKTDDVTQAICGKYSWQVTNSSAKEQGIFDDDYVKAGLDQMLIYLTPAAKQIAKRSSEPNYTNYATSAIDSGSNSLLNATLDYRSIAANFKPQGNTSKQELLKKLQTSKDDGWITAGAYYRQVVGSKLATTNNSYIPVQLQAPLQKTEDIVNLLKSMDLTMNEQDSVLKDNANSLLQTMKVVNYYMGEKVAIEGISSDTTAQPTVANKLRIIFNFKDQLQALSPEQIAAIKKNIPSSAVILGANFSNPGLLNSTNRALDSDREGFFKHQGTKTYAINAIALAGGPIVAGTTMLVLEEVRQLAFGDWIGIMNSGEKDGIAKVQELGQSMVNRAIVIWGTGMGIATAPALVLVGVAAAAAGGSFFTVGVGTTALAGLEALQIGMKYATPIMNTAATALLVNGLVLSVYVPFIPFLVFLFAVIGWFITVLEAMVAAPLVALGITHPEGHDLLGKAEQALMLLLSVFLRPILMIIGLISGVLLSWVAIKLLNLGFSTFISERFLAEGAITPMLQVFILFIIYTVIIITILNTSFSLIHVIPQKAMNWLGLHPEGSNVEGMLHEIKGSAQGGGQLAGQSAQHQLDAAAADGILSSKKEGLNKKLEARKEKENLNVGNSSSESKN